MGEPDQASSEVGVKEDSFRSEVFKVESLGDRELRTPKGPIEWSNQGIRTSNSSLLEPPTCPAESK